MTRVLTWHVHGGYLLYLSRADAELVVPYVEGRRHPYGGRAGTFPWPDNLVEVPVGDLRHERFHVVLHQSLETWRYDRHVVLTEAQRGLPQIVLEHDPPRRSPFDSRHPVAGEDVLLVQVTHFNELAWDSGDTPTRVIEHGVEVPPEARYTGELERGLVIVNNLASRGRRLGLDVFLRAREHVPLDLVGMGSEELGGLGEIPPRELPAFAARYRFLFNPIRWTSLGLAVCEAMHVGLPVVGLATTEMSRAIENGVCGYVDTDVRALVRRMRHLLADPEHAHRLSAAARLVARERYGIERFARRWTETFDEAAGSDQRVRSSTAASRPSDQRRASASKSAR
jgi:glycosyltransferase involved in cell wall biosynthesis